MSYKIFFKQNNKMVNFQKKIWSNQAYWDIAIDNPYLLAAS